MTSACPSALTWTSSSMPCPAAMAASNAARLFSTRPPPCRPRWANGRAMSASSLASLDGDDRIHLDRGSERQYRNADRAARMAAGFAEDLLHQLGGAVRHLRLVGEVARAA